MIANKEAAEETYKDVQCLLDKWGIKQLQSGFDPHVVQQAKHDAFLYTYEHFDRSRGMFNTLLGASFQSHMRLAHKERMQEQRRTSPEKQSEYILTHRPPERTWEEVRKGMTPDAQCVADIAISPSKEILEQAATKGGHGRNIRNAIRRSLQKLGWSQTRISQAVQDLIEALE